MVLPALRGLGAIEEEPELADTIAYRSGVDPQNAELIGPAVGTAHELQLFYYHDSVNRSLTVLDGSGDSVTLSESG